MCAAGAPVMRRPSGRNERREELRAERRANPSD